MNDIEWNGILLVFRDKFQMKTFFGGLYIFGTNKISLWPKIIKIYQCKIYQ